MPSGPYSRREPMPALALRATICCPYPSRGKARCSRKSAKASCFGRNHGRAHSRNLRGHSLQHHLMPVSAFGPHSITDQPPRARPSPVTCVDTLQGPPSPLQNPVFRRSRPLPLDRTDQPGCPRLPNRCPTTGRTTAFSLGIQRPQLGWPQTSRATVVQRPEPLSMPAPTALRAVPHPMPFPSPADRSELPRLSNPPQSWPLVPLDRPQGLQAIDLRLVRLSEALLTAVNSPLR